MTIQPVENDNGDVVRVRPVPDIRTATELSMQQEEAAAEIRRMRNFELLNDLEGHIDRVVTDKVNEAMDKLRMLL